jgi:glutamate carboxypeptidase
MDSSFIGAQLVAGIQPWLHQESPTHSPTHVATMAALVQERARAVGLRADLTSLGDAMGPLLHITNRAEGDLREGVLILGHMDTVHPIGTLRENPCRIDGDRFYGPGSYDMKAGIYLALTALGTMPCATALPIDMVLVPDEETGSHASRETIEAFARKSRYALVAEPARPGGGRCVTARKGTGMARLRVHGHPAHAGVAHDKGRSAIREIAHQVLALEAMTDYSRGITVSVGTIRGGTVINTVPSLCEAAVDFRVPDARAAQEMVERMNALKAIGPDMRLEIDVELNRPPMVKSAATVQLLTRAQECATQAGFVLEDAPMTGGGSDANFVAALGVPTLDGLGAEGDGAHTLNEYILISALPQRLEFWRRLLAQDLTA